VPPRYKPALWNYYNAARNEEHETNNISEGWRNRFRLVVGKHYPDLYSCPIVIVPEGTSIQRHVRHGTGTWKKGKGGSEKAMGEFREKQYRKNDFLEKIIFRVIIIRGKRGSGKCTGTLSDVMSIMNRC